MLIVLDLWFLPYNFVHVVLSILQKMISLNNSHQVDLCKLVRLAKGTLDGMIFGLQFKIVRYSLNVRRILP